jgi:hypothetical protein
VEVSVARTHDELATAFEDVIQLHEPRWRDRPDGSELGDPVGEAVRGRRHKRSPITMPRIVTKKVDGRPIAPSSSSPSRDASTSPIGLRPGAGRFSPGVLDNACRDRGRSAGGCDAGGVLGGPSKVELADRFDPIYEVFGLESSLRGAVAVEANLRVIQLRRQLKRSRAIHHFYMDGLAPARRLLSRLS